MVGLVPAIQVDGEWVELGSRVLSQVGSPLASHEMLGSALLQPDDYVVAFSDVVPGVSALATLAAAMDTTNPYHGRSATVPLDGTTAVTGLLPGARLVFSSSGSFASSWAVALRLGLPLGRIDAGDSGPGVTVRVQNTGTATGESCQAELAAVVRAFPKTGAVLEDARAFAPDAVSLLESGDVSPYAVEVSGVAGTGPARTMDMKVAAAALTVMNLTTEVSGPSTGVNVADWYRVTAGALKDFEFKASQGAENGDVVNLFVFDVSLVQIAADDGGAPASWSTEAVAVTEGGQAPGKVRAAQYGYFHYRPVVGEFSPTRSNPYPFCVRISGRATLSAGWDQ